MGRINFINNLRRTLIVVLTTFLCLFLISPSVHGYEKKRSIKVGAFTGSGYHQKKTDGSIDGYGYRYEALLAQYASWDITYVEGSWTQLQEKLSSGEIDLLGFLIKNEERDAIYDFANQSSGTSSACLITSKTNTEYSFDGYQSFDQMKVGYQRSNANITAFQQWSNDHHIQNTIEPFDSYQELFKAIDNGSVDAGLSNSYYDLSNYKIISNINTSNFYYAVTKGNDELLGELNKAINDLKTYYPDINSYLYNNYYDRSNGRGESFSDDELAYLKTNPTVTVLPGGRGAPYEKKSSKDKYVGFVPDILQNISKLTGIKFVYKNVDNRWNYINQATNQNIITSITSDIQFASKKGGFKLTQPFIDATVSIITKSNISLEEIITVAMTNDEYLKQSIQTLHPNWNITTFNSEEERLDAVYNGKQDAAIMNVYEAEYYLSSGKYNLLKETISSSVEQNVAFGVSDSSDPLLYSIISKSILMINSDDYSTMLLSNMNYTGQSNLFSLIYTNPIQFFIVMLVIIILIGGVIFLLIHTIVMRKKNKALLEATQVKTDFFSRMSHDMRTPMNGILGMTALSKNEDNLAVLHDNLNHIESSGRYMLSLINDTLDLQKLETGNFKLNPKPVHAASFFNELIEMMMPSAVSKGIKFETDTSKINLDCYALLDVTRIKQAFVNILSNANKFTPPGGTITFKSECLSKEGNIDHDCFTVSDTGIGMSQEFIDNNLFKPYCQEDSTITSKYGGTGLGLAITKSIIEEMGGSISVKSQQGKGTTFTVLLDFIIVDHDEPTSNQVEPTNQYESLQGKRVLLCEDHPLNAKITSRLLTQVGCVVDHAKDGKEGIELFDLAINNPYDVILMDIRMPNMDGLQAAKTIRELNVTNAKTIPIIAMSANAYQEDVLQSMKAGMNTHLAKPVDPKLLFETLQKYL